ncbi:uncharacterized protein LOC143819189 [Paroedura picta]|uniref:uncharacterized protein LOC143819189 n=1 Tax=Paroedura picta TaxID=143630 RepID=UPI004057A37E
MTTEELHKIKANDEEIEIDKDVVFFDSFIINQKGDCNDEIRRSLKLRRAAMKELEDILKGSAVLLDAFCDASTEDTSTIALIVTTEEELRIENTWTATGEKSSDTLENRPMLL